MNVSSRNLPGEIRDESADGVGSARHAKLDQADSAGKSRKGLCCCKTREDLRVFRAAAGHNRIDFAGRFPAMVAKQQGITSVNAELRCGLRANLTSVRIAFLCCGKLGASCGPNTREALALRARNDGGLVMERARFGNFTDDVEERDGGDMLAVVFSRKQRQERLAQRRAIGIVVGGIAGSNNYVCAEGAKFSRQAALRVDLQIQQGGRNCGARAERQQNHEHATIVGGLARDRIGRRAAEAERYPAG